MLALNLLISCETLAMGLAIVVQEGSAEASLEHQQRRSLTLHLDKITLHVSRAILLQVEMLANSGSAA